MQIVILGNGPAAISALRAIALSPGAGRETEVTIISPEPHLPYSPMFLVEYVFGHVSRRQLHLPLPDTAKLSLATIVGRRAARTDTAEQSVFLDNGDEVQYDRLLIATGASPARPPVKGLDKPGVFFVNRLDDALKLRAQVKNASRPVVVGAGAIGIETALALARQGQRVTVVEAANQVLPLMLDEDLAGHVQGKLEQLGISFFLNSKVCEISGRNRATGVVCEKEIAGDLVIVAAGFRPNIGPVNNSAIQVDRGIRVDDRMYTGVAGVYAAGDVAEVRNPFSDKYELNFTWYSAVEQGAIAGCNMMGQDRALSYSPALNILKGLDFTIASIGQRVSPGDYEVISFANERAGAFEKIYLEGSYIGHYQSIGLPFKLGYIYNLVRNRKDIAHLKRHLSIQDGHPVYLA